MSLAEPASTHKQHVDSLISTIASTAATARAVAVEALTEGVSPQTQVDLKTSVGGRAARVMLDEIPRPDVALMTAVLAVIRDNMHILITAPTTPTTTTTPASLSTPPLPSSTINAQGFTLLPPHPHHCSLSMAARVRGLSVLAQALELMLDQSVWRGDSHSHPIIFPYLSFSSLSSLPPLTFSSLSSSPFPHHLLSLIISSLSLVFSSLSPSLTPQ